MHVPNLSKQRQNPALIALGSAIRDVRKQQGVSQEKLALLAEIDRSYMGRIERGDNNVAVLTLMKIGQALNISMADLMSKASL
jgi:transcriptional regulator with XRE-family HTH domain